MNRFQILFFSVGLILCANSGYAKEKPSSRIQCTGQFGTPSCRISLSFHNCQDKIEFYWPALKIPGTKKWADEHKTFCTVSWVSGNQTIEKKHPPSQCLKLVKTFSVAFASYPEIPWQETACTHLQGNYSTLYLTHDMRGSNFEPYAIGLEDARHCKLELGRKKILRCEVLPENTNRWLKPFLAKVGTFLVLQNPLK